MDASEQAAEQIVRMTLAGSEFVIRLTGTASKNIAAGLLAATTSAEKTKGKARLATMLKSGKELKVFQLKAHDLEKFAAEAKRYGVLYTVIKPESKDLALSLDIMVKAEDASKINRILENLGYGHVSEQQTTTIEPAEHEHAEESIEPKKMDASHEQSNVDALAEILGAQDNMEEGKTPDPLGQTPTRETPSEPTSATSSRSDVATENLTPDGRRRRSVKQDIENMRESRRTNAGKSPASKSQEKQATPTRPRAPHPKTKSQPER